MITKRKKSSKFISMLLSLMMVVAFFPLLGAQQAYALEDHGEVNVDLTKGAQNYSGAEAVAIFFIIQKGIINEIITSETINSSEEELELHLDVNNDNSADIGLTAYLDFGKVTGLKLWPLETCSQREEYGLTMSNIYEYLIMDESNTYGLKYFYDTIFIQFPQALEIKDTLTCFFYRDVKEFDGADAAAINIFLGDAIAANLITARVIDASESLDRMVFEYDINTDSKVDMTGELLFDNNICTHITMTLARNFNFTNVWVNLPNTAINKYENMTTSNDYGLEYVYQNMHFDASHYKHINTAYIKLSATNFTYNGKVQKPTLSNIVNSWDDMELVEGEDYILEWSNADSMNAGTYTVEVKGIGGYAEAKIFTYTIDPKTVTPTVTVGNKVYTGKELKPALTVKAGTKTLKSGTDYTVKYTNNTKVGKASANVTLKGNYSGSKTATFKINPKKAGISMAEPGKKLVKVTMSTKVAATGGST